MHSATPPNFIDINTALTRLNLEVNVMGVVTDFLVPGPSRGRDWMSTFSISDLSYAGTSDDGLKVRFFRPMASEMPAITGTGDVVLLRGLKIKVWSGMTIGLSTHGTSWAVFPAASIPAQTPSSAVSLVNIKELRAPAPNASEMQYAISLCNSRDRSAFSELLSLPTDAAKAPLSSGVQLATRDWRDKFSLIKDLSIGSYHDLVGQVLKIYPDNGRVELYITDYTSNSLLFYYERNIDDADLSGREGDEFNYASRNSVKRKWAGPFGKMTLTVTLWPPHSYFGQHDVKENDFVHLRNVHIKFSKDSKMEGVLHSDRRYPDRIDVTILKHDEDDDRVKEVLRRKRDYSKYFSIKTVNAVNQSNALKRKEMGDDKPFSNNQAKKRRKREKEQLSKAKQHYGEEGSDKEKDLGHARTGKSRKHRTPDDSLPLQSPQTELNKNSKFWKNFPRSF